MARLGGLARAKKYSAEERKKWSAKGGKNSRKKKQCSKCQENKELPSFLPLIPTKRYEQKKAWPEKGLNPSRKSTLRNRKNDMPNKPCEKHKVVACLCAEEHGCPGCAHPLQGLDKAFMEMLDKTAE